MRLIQVSLLTFFLTGFFLAYGQEENPLSQNNETMQQAQPQMQPAAENENAGGDETAEEQAMPLQVDVSEPEEDTLFVYIKKGGVMMIPLFLLGLAGLTLIIERTLFHYKNRSWEYVTISGLLEQTANELSATWQEELEKSLLDKRELYMDKLEKGMGLLQGIGGIAPLLGFLGTVVGMIGAFSAIAAARTVNAKVVASGIQVALITTAGGLIVAVPILIIYYVYSHINQNHYRESNRIIESLCSGLPSMLSDDSADKTGKASGKPVSVSPPKAD